MLAQRGTARGLGRVRYRLIHVRVPVATRVVWQALVSKFSDLACILSGVPLVAFPAHALGKAASTNSSSSMVLDVGDWWAKHGLLNATYLNLDAYLAATESNL